MGCVSYSLKYFPGGKISKRDMKHAETRRAHRAADHQRQFSRKHWQQAVGSSGTARALGRDHRSQRLEPVGHHRATAWSGCVAP